MLKEYVLITSVYYHEIALLPLDTFWGVKGSLAMTTL